MVMHGGARRGRLGLVWQSWFCALRPVADGLMRSGMAVLVRQGEAFGVRLVRFRHGTAVRVR